MDDLEGWAERLAVPWGPRLTQVEVERGLLYYGSGKRLQAVAAKLLAGRPIKVRLCVGWDGVGGGRGGGRSPSVSPRASTAPPGCCC